MHSYKRTIYVFSSLEDLYENKEEGKVISATHIISRKVFIKDKGEVHAEFTPNFMEELVEAITKIIGGSVETKKKLRSIFLRQSPYHPYLDRITFDKYGDSLARWEYTSGQKSLEISLLIKSLL